MGDRGGFVIDAKIQHRIAKRPTDQKLKRQVVDLSILSGIELFASIDPIINQTIPDRDRKRSVDIRLVQFCLMMAQRIVQVTQDFMLKC